MITLILQIKNIRNIGYIHWENTIQQMALTTNVIKIVWGLIENAGIVYIKRKNELTQTTGLFDAFHAVKWRRLGDKMIEITSEVDVILGRFP